jgi:hypothetical protein
MFLIAVADVVVDCVSHGAMLIRNRTEICFIIMLLVSGDLDRDALLAFSCSGYWVKVLASMIDWGLIVIVAISTGSAQVCFHREYV